MKRILLFIILSLLLTCKSKQNNRPFVTKNKVSKEAKGTINGIHCDNDCEVLLTKKEWNNGKIGVEAINLNSNIEIRVISFKIKLSNYYTLSITGNKINVKENKFRELSVGDKVKIFDIRPYIPGKNKYRLKLAKPILIRIIED